MHMRMFFMLSLFGCVSCSVVNNFDGYTFRDDTESDTGNDTGDDSGENWDSDSEHDTCAGGTYRQCSGSDVGTFNQCDELIDTLQCLSHRQCVNVSATEAECQCAGNRTGSDCLQCAAGYADKNNDCGTCVRFVDLNAAGTSDGMSWENAYTGVQGGIFSAATAVSSLDWPDECEVWVKAGTYFPTQGSGSNATILMSDDVSLYGGFSDQAEEWSARDYENNLTVLDGSGVLHVVTAANQVRLDGFTVTGGIAYAEPGVANGQVGAGMLADGGGLEVANSVFTGNQVNLYGGALYALNGATVSVSNTRFTANTAEQAGGAVAAENAEITILDCDFTDNIINHADVFIGHGGAIHVGNASNLVIENSYFSGNVAGASGGAVHASGSSVRIVNTLLEQNETQITGAGLYVDGGTLQCDEVQFVGNVLNNSGRGGGAAVYGSVDVSFSNCVFAKNTVGAGVANPSGGGLYVSDSIVDVTNCTVAFNATLSSDEPHAGGVYLDGGAAMTLLNSIVYANTCSSANATVCDLEVDTDSSFVATYSDIRGHLLNPVYNNIDADPLFVSSSPLDLHLQAGSPCIDEGTNAFAPTIDVEGTGRPVGNGWDMGAYEQ